MDDVVRESEENCMIFYCCILCVIFIDYIIDMKRRDVLRDESDDDDIIH